jgi:uncharacterized membrane protein
MTGALPMPRLDDKMGNRTSDGIDHHSSQMPTDDCRTQRLATLWPTRGDRALGSNKRMSVTTAAPQPSPPSDALDPLRHHAHYQSDDSPYAGGSSFMERLSGKVASGMGTPAFIVVSTVLILGWVFANGATTYVSQTIQDIGNGKQFDPEPWILLNLLFSAVAFFTGALVIIAQKAQTRTDRANEQASAKHRDELSQANQELLQKNTDLTVEIHRLAESLTALTEAVHKHVCLSGD